MEKTELALLLASMGGGSGGGDSVFKVTFGYENEQYTCDKTYAEIEAASTAGKFIYGVADSLQLSFVMLRNLEGSKSAIFTEPISVNPSNVAAGTFMVFENGGVYYAQNVYPVT